jgi:hypothetical protein
MMKRKIAIGITVMAVAAFICGTSLLAFAELGTQDDPLITLSYLTEVFKAQIMNNVKNTEQEMTQKFNSRISTLESQLEASAGESQTAKNNPDIFSVVTLKNGQSLTCSVGAEIMLRVGTANGFGNNAPALVNYTDGATLSPGTALTTNHMYLVTIEGNGVRATADTVKVLVRGSYKIT